MAGHHHTWHDVRTLQCYDELYHASLCTTCIASILSCQGSFRRVCGFSHTRHQHSSVRTSRQEDVNPLRLLSSTAASNATSILNEVIGSV